MTILNKELHLSSLSYDYFLKVIKILESELNIHIPASEKKVLRILLELKEASGPAIVKFSNNDVSLAAVYELLRRLTKKNVISANEKFFNLGGVETRRVIYKLNEDIAKKLT